MPAAQSVSAWGLLRRSVAGYHRWWKIYIGTVLAGLLPIIILVSSSDSSSATAAPVGGMDAYASLIMLVIVLAVIAVAARQVAGQPKPSLRAAYFDGTSRLVAYTLSLLLLVTYAFLVPTISAVRLIIWLWRRLGRRFSDQSIVRRLLRVALVLLASLFAPVILLLNVVLWLLFSLYSPDVQYGSSLWLFGLPLLVIIPAVYILIRGSFASFEAALTPVGPIVALRAARRLTQNRFWLVFRRLALLLAVLLGLALLAVALLLCVGLAIPNYAVLSTAFRIIMNLIGLPLAVLYLMHLYRELHGPGAS